MHGWRQMALPTMIMGTAAIVLWAVAHRRDPSLAHAGMLKGANLLVQIIPLLIFAMVVAGMVQVLIPEQGVARWVGAESGWRGLLIGTVAGGLTPGGPFIAMPLAAGLIRAGAGVGTMVSFLTAWSLLAVHRLPIEIGIMGWRFTAVRLASTFLLPPVAGWIAHTLFSQVRVP